jgi:hypothetical protein
MLACACACLVNHGSGRGVARCTHVDHLVVVGARVPGSKKQNKSKEERGERKKKEKLEGTWRG